MDGPRTDAAITPRLKRDSLDTLLRARHDPAIEPSAEVARNAAPTRGPRQPGETCERRGRRPNDRNGVCSSSHSIATAKLVHAVVKERQAPRFVSRMAAPAAKTLFSSGVTLRERGALLRSARLPFQEAATRPAGPPRRHAMRPGRPHRPGVAHDRQRRPRARRAGVRVLGLERARAWASEDAATRVDWLGPAVEQAVLPSLRLDRPIGSARQRRHGRTTSRRLPRPPRRRAPSRRDAPRAVRPCRSYQAWRDGEPRRGRLLHRG